MQKRRNAEMQKRIRSDAQAAAGKREGSGPAGRARSALQILSEGRNTGMVLR